MPSKTIPADSPLYNQYRQVVANGKPDANDQVTREDQVVRALVNIPGTWSPLTVKLYVAKRRQSDGKLTWRADKQLSGRHYTVRAALANSEWDHIELAPVRHGTVCA